MDAGPKRSVLVCETQPVSAEGLRSLLSSDAGLECVRTVDSLAEAVELVRQRAPGVLVVDKAFGAQAVLDALGALRASGAPTAAVVWGMSMTELEALRFLQGGAKGVIRKTASLQTLLECLRSVAAGVTWMEPDVLQERRKPALNAGPALTPRERQVIELVGQGLKNREIAQELGIRPGTVKVHLKHIFEKTGVRDRFGLALAGLRSRTAGK